MDTRFIVSTATSHQSDGTAFPSTHPSSLRSRLRDPDFKLEEHLPIKTTEDVLRYADDVAGSIASGICYLAWSILTTSSSVRPVDNLAWSSSVVSATSPTPAGPQDRMYIVKSARTMGQALQLVNIARDVAKDATIGRVYAPLSSFPSGSALLDVLLPSTTLPPYGRYSLPLLDIADEMRRSSGPAMDKLPWVARGGTKAMAASYFEIAEETRRRGGEVDQKGVKVKRWRRALAAARAMWGWV